LALAITFPLQAIRIVPPGTSIKLLLVDGLPVGVGVPVGEIDADGEPVAVEDAVPLGEPDGDAVGDGAGVGVAVTAPPTAFPF
jgi:hypothetical protein